MYYRILRLQNKRRLTPFIDKILVTNHNSIYNTLLTVKYSEEVASVLKKKANFAPSFIVRNRCRVILLKMTEPRMSCSRIAASVGCCRDFVSDTIHRYNTGGMDSVLMLKAKSGRPGKLAGHMDEIYKALGERIPRTAKEGMSIIAEVSGVTVKETWARTIMNRLGFKCRKLQPIPGKADPKKQKEWIENLQPVVNEAKAGERILLFMDAVHFTLGSFTCNVWSKTPLYLPTGAGRNRFNFIGAVDPFSLNLFHSHSMEYVDANEIMSFLQMLRDRNGNMPVSIVLDNARYQHCKAVMEQAKKLDITLIFLPAYSPNLNIIERLWKYTRKTVLNGRFFDMPAKFHAALKFFYEEDFENHRENLRPLLTLKFQSFENAVLLTA